MLVSRYSSPASGTNSPNAVPTAIALPFGAADSTVPEVNTPSRGALAQTSLTGLHFQLPKRLTRLGFEVLRVLLSRGETVTNDELARSVWGHQATPDAGFVQTAVYQLRAAFHEAGAKDIIENVRGVGDSR